MRICRRPDEQALAQATADRIAELLRSALDARGEAHLALSGGSSPRPMIQSLAEHDLAWERIHVYQVDERVVEPDSAERNWRMIEETLVGRTAAVGHPLPSDEQPTAFDVVHLGLGTDGHTASWPPGHPVLDSTATVAAIEDFNGFDRLTLTPTSVNRARAVVWFVPGAEKDTMVRRLLAGDPTIPASRVHRTNAELFINGNSGDPR